MHLTSRHHFFSWNLELSTIASEEGSEESVNMWNLDRAFSEVERRWKFRYLAFRQTKYCRWFIPKMKMVIYYLHAIQTIDNLKKKSSMRRLRFFRGVQLWQLFFFVVDEERERSKIPFKMVHNWPSNETPFKSPAKRHLNGVSLVDQWWPNIKNAGLVVLWYPGVTSIAKELYNCLILQGGPDPCPLPPTPSNYRELICFWSLMSQHIRFRIHFVHVAFTSTKDTASLYTFKRIFISMPIHLLVLFLLFIMSNLFYRGDGFQFVYFKRS